MVGEMSFSRIDICTEINCCNFSERNWKWFKRFSRCCKIIHSTDQLVLTVWGDHVVLTASVISVVYSSVTDAKSHWQVARLSSTSKGQKKIQISHHPYVKWVPYWPRTSPVFVKVCRKTWGSQFLDVHRNLDFCELQLDEFCLRTWICSLTELNLSRSSKVMNIDNIVCFLTGFGSVWRRFPISAGKSSVVMRNIFGWMALLTSKIAENWHQSTQDSLRDKASTRTYCLILILGLVVSLIHALSRTTLIRSSRSMAGIIGRWQPIPFDLNWTIWMGTTYGSSRTVLSTIQQMPWWDPRAMPIICNRPMPTKST